MNANTDPSPRPARSPRRGLGPALVVLALASAGCAVTVDDLTDDPLVHPRPLAPSIFTARVSADRPVRAVTVEVEGSSPVPMRDVGGGRYEGGVTLGACEEVARYRFAVTVDGVLGGGDTRRFPATGAFSGALTGQPPDCAGMPIGSRTFDVDDVRDLPDAAPGDGVCRTAAADGGRCTLRAAVMEANALPGADLVRLPIARYRLTRTAPEADSSADASVNDLDITEGVTIEGVGVADDVTLLDFLTCGNRVPDGRCRFDDPGTDLTDDPDPAKDRAIPKIDAGGLDRVFQIHASVSEERPAGLRDLALLNGESCDRDDDGCTDTARPGGGVRNDGTLVLDRVAVVGNRIGTGFRVPGGGLANYGTLSARDVAFVQNEVSGMNATGGAFYNHDGARARVARALFAFNRARFSSALRNGGPGGADDGPAARVTLENVTFFDNARSSSASRVVSTIGDAGETDLNAVTLANHRETAYLIDGNRNTRLRGSLLVDNGGFPGRPVDYCRGGLASGGGNVTDAPCPFARGSTANRTGAGGNIAKGILEDLGGFTPVYPLFGRADEPNPGNPAVDAAVVGPWPLLDQRGTGFERHVDGDGDGRAVPDAGAFELGADAAPGT